MHMNNLVGELSTDVIVIYEVEEAETIEITEIEVYQRLNGDCCGFRLSSYLEQATLDRLAAEALDDYSEYLRKEAMEEP